MIFTEFENNLLRGIPHRKYKCPECEDAFTQKEMVSFHAFVRHRDKKKKQQVPENWKMFCGPTKSGRGSVETANKSTPVKSYRLEENSEPLKVLTPASSPEVGGEKTEFPVAEVDSFSAVDHPKVKYLPNGAVEPVGIVTLSVALDEPIGIEGFPPELDQPIRSNEALEEEIITPVSSGIGGDQPEVPSPKVVRIRLLSVSPRRKFPRFSLESLNRISGDHDKVMTKASNLDVLSNSNLGTSDSCDGGSRSRRKRKRSNCDNKKDEEVRSKTPMVERGKDDSKISSNTASNVAKEKEEPKKRTRRGKKVKSESEEEEVDSRSDEIQSGKCDLTLGSQNSTPDSSGQNVLSSDSKMCPYCNKELSSANNVKRHVNLRCPVVKALKTSEKGFTPKF